MFVHFNVSDYLLSIKAVTNAQFHEVTEFIKS